MPASSFGSMVPTAHCHVGGGHAEQGDRSARSGSSATPQLRSSSAIRAEVARAAAINSAKRRSEGGRLVRLPAPQPGELDERPCPREQFSARRDSALTWRDCHCSCPAMGHGTLAPNLVFRSRRRSPPCRFQPASPAIRTRTVLLRGYRWRQASSLLHAGRVVDWYCDRALVQPLMRRRRAAGTPPGPGIRVERSAACHGRFRWPAGRAGSPSAQDGTAPRSSSLSVTKRPSQAARPLHPRSPGGSWRRM